LRWRYRRGDDRAGRRRRRVLKEKFGAEGAVERGFEGAGKGDVDFSGGEGFHLDRGMHLVKRELYVGIKLTIVADEAGKEAAGSPEEEADCERSDLALQRAPGNLQGSIGSEEGFTSLCEEKLAMRGEAGATCAAMEENTANLPLQVGELLADGGLRDMKAATGLAEGTVIRDGAEVPQVSQLHGKILLPIAYRFFRWEVSE
jgi:hypothetical protein